MDAIATMLDGPRARGAFLLRSRMDPPWSLRIEDRAPLTIAAVVRGHAWVIPDDGEPVRMDRGDIAIFRGPDPYTVADDPATPVQAIIGVGQTLHGGRRLRPGRALEPRRAPVGQRRRR